MKAIVTGATGVVGRYLLQHLVERGDWDIVAVSRRRPDIAGRYEHLAVDLLDPADCRAKLGGARRRDARVLQRVPAGCRPRSSRGAQHSHAGQSGRERRGGVTGARARESGGGHEVVRQPPRPVSHAGQGRPSAACRRQLLFRPAGLARSPAARQGVDVVSRTPACRVRFQRREPDESGARPGRLRDAVPRTGSAVFSPRAGREFPRAVSAHRFDACSPRRWSGWRPNRVVPIRPST